MGRKGRDARLGREDSWWNSGWQTLWSHICSHKTGGPKWERNRPHDLRAPGWEIKPQSTVIENPLGVEAATGETPGLTAEFVGETHRVPEHRQAHPHGSQHQKDPLCLWVVGEVTESRATAEQAALFPLWPLPHTQHQTQWCGLPCPGKYLRLHVLQHNRCTKTKKYGPSERIDQNSSERTKWQGDSQPIRCRVQTADNKDARRNEGVWPLHRGTSEGIFIPPL